MKLKRLIAFTVVMAVIISCFCVVATTVSANTIEGENLLFHLTGGITNKEGEGNISVITYYGVYANGTDNDTSDDIDYEQYKQEYYEGTGVKKQQYIYDKSPLLGSVSGIAQSGNGYLLDTSVENVAIGVVASKEYDATSEKTGKYYDVTFAHLQDNYQTKVSDKFTDGNSVISQSFDFCIPAGTKTNARTWTFQFRDGEYKNTNTWTLTLKNRNITIKAADNASNNFTITNNGVNIQDDTWYNFDIRSKILENGKMALGLYLDGIQFAYMLGNDNSTNFTSGVYIYRNAFKTPDNLKLAANDHVHTYYDEFKKRILPDAYAPAPDEITLSVDDGVEAKALISGNDSIKNATLILALFDSNDRFQKLVSSSVINGVGGSRTMTCAFPTGVAYDNYKVFLFDSLTSLKPLTEVDPSK